MLAVGEKAAAVTGVDFSRPTLLAFFETDCPTCQLTLPYLNQLGEVLGERANLVAVSQDSDCATEALAQSLPIEIAIHIDRGLVLSREYDPVAVPTLYLIDAGGRVAATQSAFDKIELNAISKQLCELAGVEPIEPAAAHDGNPDSKPGCTSRHLEPAAEGETPAAVNVYERRGQRAGRVELRDDQDPYDYCYEHGFGDPLPVVPPTVERVERMLAAVDRPAEEIIAHIPPNYAPATVEKIAANAVMAGCFPELMRSRGYSGSDKGHTQ